MCFTEEGAISTLSSKPLKLGGEFKFLGSNISSTESDLNVHRAKTWTAVYRLPIKWKSNQYDNIKRYFFQAMTVSLQLYGCTSKALIKTYGEKVRWKLQRMFRTVFNKSWKQHPRKQELYCHLPPVQVRRTRQIRYCWRNKYELISNFLSWTSTNR